MKRILFVDDDASMLGGLRNILRKQRTEWDMVFAPGGAEALAEMAKGPFDVVITDMRMPGMDGATLLTRVRDSYPGTARIVLSGHSESEAIGRSLPVAHQFLNKPCDFSVLQSAIARVCALRDLLQNAAARDLVGRVDRLPSPPMTYLCLNEALANPNNGWDAVAAIVEEDPAMCAKILQLVNSGYFGLAHRVTSVVQASSYLGMGVLRGLALNAHVLGAVEGTTVSRAVLDEVQRTSLATATLAKQKIKDRAASDDAFSAGIVHDIGKIVLALTMPQPAREAERVAAESGRRSEDVEREMMGVSHAEVGAYLLGVWGLPFQIVEATAFHHNPSAPGASDSQVLSAIHLADAVVSEQADGMSTLDLDFIERVGLSGELESWRAAAIRYLGQSTPRAATAAG